MLIDGKIVKILRIENLNSKVSFIKWIKENLKTESLYSNDDIYSSNRYLAYLEYLEKNVLPSQPLEDKPKWIESLSRLKKEKQNDSK